MCTLPVRHKQKIANVRVIILMHNAFLVVQTEIVNIICDMNYLTVSERFKIHLKVIHEGQF